jgi:hypothetical protein
VSGGEVKVPFDANPTDQAVLLLAAAEELDLGPSAVKTSEGAFIVPEEVHQRAFPPEKKEEEAPQQEQAPPPPKKAPAKKSAKKK